MNTVATGSWELKWTKKAKVPDGEVEDGAEGQRKAGTTGLESKDKKKWKKTKKGAPAKGEQLRGQLHNISEKDH